MTSRPPRRFRITDGLVLIAATAIGLAWSRPLGIWFEIWRTPKTAWLIWATTNFATLAYPCTAIWALAILWLDSLGDRRPRQRRFRRPGILACFLVALVTFAQALVVLGIFSARWLMTGHFLADPKGYASKPGILIDGFLFAAPAFGLVVLAGWISSWLNGRWRPEPSWTDRAGRFLGIYWIISGINLCIMRASIALMMY